MFSILNRILPLAFFFVGANQVYCFDLVKTGLAVDSINYKDILLDKWKFHPGDNMDWARSEFDDNTWGSINPSKDVTELSALWDNGICWMRLTLPIPDATTTNKLALLIKQTGACVLVGQSPAEFIRTFRLNRAAVLLPKQNNNIRYRCVYGGVF
jgi:hypothetical protein